jgi:hypothetical protein
MEPDVISLTTNFTGGNTAEQAYVLTYWGFVILSTFLHVLSWWQIFHKAGQSGWKAIVPIYNYYIMLKIIGKPAWWLILLFIPLANIIFIFMICLETAKVFNKGMGFALGLFFLSPIFYLILAFGKSQYIGFGGALASVNTNPPVVPSVNSPLNPVVMPPLNPTVMPSANTPTNPPVNPPTANPGQ